VEESAIDLRNSGNCLCKDGAGSFLIMALIVDQNRDSSDGVYGISIDNQTRSKK
jgi:hypothetical protein